MGWHSSSRCWGDQGNRGQYLAKLSEFHSHFTTSASGSPAACSAHSPAFTFPGTPLWAGHRRNSMMAAFLALHNGAMGFLASLACILLGPGSSEGIRLMAAWASVIVIMNRLRANTD
jgi:hypothetical protein